MQRYLLAIGIMFVMASDVAAQQQTRPALADLQRWAAVIKPSPDELKWRQIPWVLDLAKGQRLAEREERPIFLWVTGDDPLERC